MYPKKFYSEKSYIDNITHLSTTKKSLLSSENKKYTFLVNPIMDKPSIKLTIEESLNVKIYRVNTACLPTTKKVVGKNIGYTSKLKKAIVKLDPKYQIKLFSEI